MRFGFDGQVFGETDPAAIDCIVAGMTSWPAGRFNLLFMAPISCPNNSTSFTHSHRGTKSRSVFSMSIAWQKEINADHRKFKLTWETHYYIITYRK
jgi:hypothetical protein